MQFLETLRYYSPTERKFITDDPHGVNPDGNWNNPFSPIRQLDDGAGLQVFANHDPVNGRDDWGLMSSFRNKSSITGCKDIGVWDTQGRSGNWGVVRANTHLIFGGGKTVEFNGKSQFSNYVQNTIDGTIFKRVDEDIEGLAKFWSESMQLDSERRFQTASLPLNNFGYYSGGDWTLSGTIGNGGDQGDGRLSGIYSSVDYKPVCCLHKSCCRQGSAQLEVRCKIEITLKDKFGYFYVGTELNKFGTPYWTVIHMFHDYNAKLEVPCN
ncbi:hypothetical protein SMSP2_01085 [Limihaloglobus sulfuriphilus]|uniref:Uncharacterized protein n=1 Tax=Limihaloglobus sulfuriphilus TaxID=1851148 RepID=A0A1Q2MDK9_9BACT|nr:hypothetical protein [Limihaloglobus sulfuriphilus]AQQ70724.1 hypothetical protein SMSP2_01085 [Limihaloglobus sulfuriphilus]